ncbi:MAG: magnesium chelatase subunit D family protein [Candidatus Tectomicrobia bacterium]|uniref:Mg-protoporphyrin IX chelatase n=1 Tax=Tectimicrobiota bacterium TaxID=2528274 RepID=A0A932G1Q6_UNCTE|nr:magnesium chelatase subunit D family protein [Candidatus Tectomicrobia bacterium]
MTSFSLRDRPGKGPGYALPAYPFAALVGQERMKEALLLNAVNPRLGGVLIRGQKGTGKSIAVRALADLLPEREVVLDCPYNCHPWQPSRMCDRCRTRLEQGESLPVTLRQVRVVELPLNATEDRILGGVDFEHALKEGERRLEPGILAQANRGILYVDEVNLLDDHLAHLLLDALAMGMNRIEREGLSFAHPAEFMLVGTMNPEEGELGPQLLDRFGLCVEVEGLSDPQERLEIIRRQGRFEAEPVLFQGEWIGPQDQLRRGILQAQRILDQVQISQDLLERIAGLCLAHHVAGHRADLLLRAAARTLTACQGRLEATWEDILHVAGFVLLHRSRQAVGLQGLSSPPRTSRPQEEQREKETVQAPPDLSGPGPGEPEGSEESAENEPEGPASTVSPDLSGEVSSSPPQASSEDAPRPESTDEPPAPGEPLPLLRSYFALGESFPVRSLMMERDRQLRDGSGRRSPTRTLRKSGRYIRSTPVRRNDDLAFDATVRAAAPYQIWRERKGVAIAIEEADIREKVRQRKTSNLLLFVVDASGSMGSQLMSETKGAILSLLLDAYQRRDKVGLVAFRETRAELLLPPTNSIELAKKLLEDLPTGGKTPLVHGLMMGYQVVKNHLRKDPGTSPLIILISDYRPNVPFFKVLHPDYLFDERVYPRLLQEIFDMARHIQADPQVRSLVIDVNQVQDHLAQGQAIARRLGGPYVRIRDLKARGILRLVRGWGTREGE